MSKIVCPQLQDKLKKKNLSEKRIPVRTSKEKNVLRTYSMSNRKIPGSLSKTIAPPPPLLFTEYEICRHCCTTSISCLSRECESSQHSSLDDSRRSSPLTNASVFYLLHHYTWNQAASLHLESGLPTRRPTRGATYFIRHSTWNLTVAN